VCATASPYLEAVKFKKIDPAFLGEKFEFGPFMKDWIEGDSCDNWFFTETAKSPAPINGICPPQYTPAAPGVRLIDCFAALWGRPIEVNYTVLGLPTATSSILIRDCDFATNQAAIITAYNSLKREWCVNAASRPPAFKDRHFCRIFSFNRANRGPMCACAGSAGGERSSRAPPLSPNFL
jgi:hypothetical protein